MLSLRWGEEAFGPHVIVTWSESNRQKAPGLGARGKSQTAPRAVLFRHLCVAKPRYIPDMPAVWRLDLAKNASLSIAEHFYHGLLAGGRHPLEEGRIADLPAQGRELIFSRTAPAQVINFLCQGHVLTQNRQGAVELGLCS